MSAGCLLILISETVHGCHDQSFAVEALTDADVVDAAGVVVAATVYGPGNLYGNLTKIKPPNMNWDRHVPVTLTIVCKSLQRFGS